MAFKYSWLHFLLLFLIAPPCHYWLLAQSSGIPEEIQLETIPVPGGPKANMVSRMMQDSLGFIWLPSQQGLHRYDGTSFTTFPFSENGVPEYVESVMVDKNGHYWAASYRNGLFRFDPISGDFEHFFFSGDVEGESPNQIYDLSEGPAGRIWMATRNGVLAFDPKAKTFKHYNTITIDGESLPLGQVQTVITDRSGSLWFGAGDSWKEGAEGVGGLLRYVESEGTFRLFLFDRKEKLGWDALLISDLYEDPHGYIWVGTTSRKLYRFDPRTGVYQKHNIPQKSGFSHSTITRINSITMDCDGHLWLAVFLEGIYCYDPDSGAARLFLPTPEKAQDETANTAWKLMTAADRSIWVSGGQNGVYVKRFEPCTGRGFGELIAHSLDDYQISAIEGGPNGDIWIGTQHNGLLRYHPGGGIQPANLDAGATSIKALCQDQKDNLWIGCWPQPCGLNRLDPESGRVETFRHDPVDPNSLSNDLIMDIQEDREGQLWIATWGGGLNRFDPESGIFTRFQNDPGDSVSLGGNYVTSLYEDGRGRLWIGGGGALVEPLEPAFLDRFDPADKTFVHHFDKMEVEAFPGLDAVTDINGAPDGSLWISKRGVIVHLNPESGEVRSFSPSDFSRNYNWYWSIHPDSAGGVWSTSLDGLAHLNPESQRFTIFSWNKLPIGSNWWQPMEAIGPDRLFVGGQDGSMQFSGRSLLESQVAQLPKVILAGFDNQGKTIRPEYLLPEGARIWEATQIILPPDQNIFSLTLTAPYFRKNNPISIEYILQGYDLEWNILDAKGAVPYFKVPPGHYTFQARVRSETGQIAGPSLNLDIIMLAPWWQRWWAWTLYALALLGASYFFYRFLLRRKLAMAEAQQLKEMDILKNRLYTNITHEFRTPLTVISGITDEITGHEKEKALIRRNSRRLLGLVNQVLSLQKLESKQMELRPTPGDIARFLNYLTESFQSLAQRKHLRLVYYADPESISMAFDEEKIQQLVANLLSNAIQFTPEYGKVEVGLSLVSSGRQVRLKVRDSGVGIPADQLDQIFDRFQQAENQQGRTGEGTGIGLALVKELVKLMDGRIEVESQPGRGTIFTVLLPRLEAELPDLPEERLKSKVNFDPALFLPPPPLAGSTLAKGDEEVVSSAGENHILVLEDNQDVAYYLRTILQDQYRIELARNGREGLEKAFEKIPDIVISDVMMPEIDGFAFCAALKKDERTSHIPVILLTAKATQEERLQGLKTGADAYLAKPFDKEELLIRIEKLLELRKKMQLHFRTKNIHQLPDYQDAFLRKLQQVVEKNLGDEHFGTPQLCRAMAMSRTQLHRKIKALLDIPTARFIQLTRLHRARHLILTTDKNIGEISYETGFKDPSYFTKLYVAEFEEKPSETHK